MFFLHLVENPDSSSIQNDPEEYQLGKPEYQYINSKGPIIEGNEHGGSWLDSFGNDSGVDLSLSNNINISNGEVRLRDTDYQLVFEDNFSTPLNNTKWINNTGNGTTLYTYPILKAVKNNQAQSKHAYICTREKWGYLRIVEFDWNSYYDSAPNSYGHNIDMFISKENYYKDKYFYVSIGGDRKVNIGDAKVYYLYSSPNPISANKWYHFKMIIEEESAHLEVRDMSNNLIINKSVNSITFPINQSGPFSVTFASISSADYFKFDSRMDNVKIYEKKYYPTGNLTSDKIELPQSMNWDNLLLNKTELFNSSIKVALLNGTTDKIIAGYESITLNGETDISGLNALGHRSIKLRALFEADNAISPRLFYWGVSWIANNAWRDTFFKGDNVKSSTRIDAIDGFCHSLPPYLQNGILRSKIIEVPSGYHLDTLIINKSEPDGTSINVSLFDAVTNTTITGFEYLNGTKADISSIDVSIHPEIWLLTIFQPFNNQTPILFDWSMNWVENVTPPSNISKCVDIDPDTLNLKSKGRWITCYIEPQDGSDPVKINISTILLNGTISAESHPSEVGDYDNDSLPDLMVKFNRSDVQKIVSVGDNVTLSVEGYYYDGSYFKCSDTIRVINPPDEEHNKGNDKGKGKKR